MFKYVILFSAFTVIVLTSSDSVVRCFSFTWLGPSYNNESVFLNATCSDATKLAAGVPCVQPLVVSEDGSWPDVDYIWRNHRLQATCVLSANNVCAKYTYYFDGKPENSTYMCTRAIDNEGAAIRSGCFTRVNGSSSVKVCLCQSVPGGVPCNKAAPETSSFMLLIIFSLILSFIFIVKN